MTGVSTGGLVKKAALAESRLSGQMAMTAAYKGSQRDTLVGDRDRRRRLDAERWQWRWWERRW